MNLDDAPTVVARGFGSIRRRLTPPRLCSLDLGHHLAHDIHRDLLPLLHQAALVLHRALHELGDVFHGALRLLEVGGAKLLELLTYRLRLIDLLLDHLREHVIVAAKGVEGRLGLLFVRHGVVLAWG